MAQGQGNFFFAGHSTGYVTKYQTQEHRYFSSFVHKVDFENYQYCTFTRDLQTYYFIKKYSESEIVDVSKNSAVKNSFKSDTVARPTVKTQDKSFIFITPIKMQPLAPKPCAYKSASLVNIDYYRGENVRTYEIVDENAGNNVATTTAYLMSSDASFLC